MGYFLTQDKVNLKKLFIHINIYIKSLLFVKFQPTATLK